MGKNWDRYNPQPVKVDGVVSEMPSGQSGNVKVTESALPAGAATQATLEAIRSLVAAGLTVTVSNQPTTQPISGSVTVSNFPATQPVSGSLSVSNFPATQAVSGSVTANSPSPSATAAGLTPYRNQALSNAPASVKTSQGRVFGYHIANPNTSWSYIHIYNALVANVTVGTTVPIASFGIPANAVLDGYWNLSDTFSTAITLAATISPLNTVATAPTNALLVQLAYV